ncbi:hypothetical protein BSKO_02918 [Bryopsis sp. KO-2023]|nr:hypothetical protein BSKO_02918 [Bryopsis sp. KO-2023]
MRPALAAAFLCFTWCGLLEPGAAQLRPKIIGGEKANVGEFPFMASIRFPMDHRTASRRGKHFCGGVLIAKNIVLSARHCANNHKNPDVHIGRYSRTGDEKVEVFKTKEIRKHKDSKFVAKGVYDYDIALYVLDGDSKTSPVGLRSNERCFQENSGCNFGTVIGWGLTNFDNKESESEDLLKVNVPLIPRDICDESIPELKKFGGLKQSMVCAGEVGKDACSNDSGGPLLVGKSVAGIVSFGYGGCGGESPGVYASVPQAKAWVEQQMKEIKEGAISFQE